MWHLLIALMPAVMAEPTLFMFPTNPMLHPQGMYPNSQMFRGKVRDLPDSGLIYLNRIKPIGLETATKKVEKNTEPKLSMIEKFDKALSSFEKYTSKEDKIEHSDTARLADDNIQFVSLTKSTKVDEPKKSVLKTKAQMELSIPEEAELDRILDEIMTGNDKNTASLPKIGRSATKTAKRHSKSKIPRVISFDGTARVETMPRKSRPVTVRLMPRKLYSQTAQSGADFDPWERLGQ